MADKKTADGDELTFVVTNNPLDNSAANKRQVRSVAALRSWPERRKKTFEQYDQSAGGARGGFVLEPSQPVPDASNSKAAKRRQKKSIATESSASAETERQPADDELFEKCTRATNAECNCIHCRSERRYRFAPSQGQTTTHTVLRASTEPQRRKRTADGQLKSRAFNGDLAMITPPTSPLPSPRNIVDNRGRAEPFNCYPVPYRPWFDHILSHMMKVFAPRGWPALKITNDQGTKWEWFMTQHALAEPALFYVRLLFATGDLVRLKVLQPEVTYWLQAQAINAINEALSDTKRATSDGLILAVGRIALHEALYGDKKAANTVHRPAQKRMIELRGGMKELPFPDLVKRLMRWADRVMGMQSGTGRMLEDEEEIPNFSIPQHVDVLEKWVPTEGQDLRKKIKISDLLTPADEEPS